ncbi:hypothetical protein ANN_09240, partial [Periplaneta americana]
LKIPEASITPLTTGRHLRDELRKRLFESWCQLPRKGKGVVIYEEYPRANSWISNKKNLSSSEYINAISMSCNLTAVRSVPGRAFNTTRCRQPGCNETETLGHVLGFCRKGELLRKNRHHRVRGAIACLRNKGWEVHEEVHCISVDDSHRRADIIAINRQQQKAIIIDQTIRMERDLNQAHHVDQEKRAIYEPCIPYLSANRTHRHDTTVHDVIRLLIPALYKNQSDSLMAADGDCYHLCKLMAPVRHRWSINDVIGGIRNTVMPSDFSLVRFGIRSKIRTNH